MSSEPYTTKGLPTPPTVSVKTVPMGGLLVDVYGLEELPAGPSPVTCLWLLHPRMRTRARMQDIASRVIDAYNNRMAESSASPPRGLVALAFDMPNHGTRLVSEQANKAWNQGNELHAIDMVAGIKGARNDMSGLMDVVGGYLDRKVDEHVCLGWSLGGHAVWQAWLAERRLHAAVAIVGCPDFIGLMRDRAKTSDLDIPEGQTFLGSKYFPDDLAATCARYDPRGVIFGAQESHLPEAPLSDAERERVRSILAERGCTSNRRLLLCSGADDKLVPYTNSAPFVKLLQDVGGVPVQDKVYEGVGHAFSADMVQDAVEFLVDAVSRGNTEKSKI
ncbi:hypothetical protein GMORB2_3449 [Geosmithia morbida]|uniref:AB hydrolase-1 domain-containing protein n=1 Tax=Geosmithia morbida TaxID=1094350 RepID=A0A9P4YN74_9HYPO|nr:uncharacterized protein GMORB2_3449 [Geosmithia morbida]KAF4120038.1 hypothetical protein GMORB2_3449 [Geosmithia morbida]